jgi:hypothetical protein
MGWARTAEIWGAHPGHPSADAPVRELWFSQVGTNGVKTAQGGEPNRHGCAMGNEPTRPAGQEPGPFHHGTKVDLKPGELLQPGYSSNFGERRKANYVYLTAALDAATWERN